MIYTNKMRIFLYKNTLRINNKLYFLKQLTSIKCQLLSIQETYFVWVGRATSRWQPKTKMIIYQTT